MGVFLFLFLLFGLLGLWSSSMLFSCDFPFMVGGSVFNVLFYLDPLAFLFLSVLFSVVACVWSFSKEYMEGELYYVRFHYILGSFVVSMVILICSSNWFFLLLGWDGLGVTSFLLICFYKTSVSWSSSLKTFLMKRLGDGFLLVGLALMLASGGWGMKEVTTEVSFVVSIVLLAALFTKSAQFPFSSWLPAAMAAPTPVSALVHSSTLVTAGIYVLIRVSYLLSPKSLLVLKLVGLWTVFMASGAALVENDVKKVMAFSTLSQLGLMVFSLGLGLPSLCFFHLVSHALFKAKMFMCAGYSLLSSKHNQDVRSLELYHTSPVIEVSIFLSLVNLKGLWFLSGFFSKDFLLEKDSIVLGGSQMFLLLVSLLFTSAYSFRLFFLLSQASASSAFGFGGKGTHVPVYLSCASVLFGFVVKSTFLSVGKVGVLWKGILLLLVFSGGFLGYFFCFSFSSSFLKGMGSLNYFNSDYFLKSASSMGLALFNTLDKGIFPLFFVLPKTMSSFRLLFSSVFSGVFLLGFALLFFS